ncbi:hypothetical protein [Paenibacillus medicaginis]|uniref:DUF2917 domain-containing protein n=1 Tax=Paenibacillus medicaginis TaxID=1470560 RepID=A0ABV5C4I5_9BACL
MRKKNIRSCSVPQNITLVQRLQPLVGRTVTVFQPGHLWLTKTTGKLTNVSKSSFTVGTKVVAVKNAFFIVLNEQVKRTKPIELTAIADDMGELQGSLIQVGRDFVEFMQTPGRSVPTLFPLNKFTEVFWEDEEE